MVALHMLSIPRKFVNAGFYQKIPDKDNDRPITNAIRYSKAN